MIPRQKSDGDRDTRADLIDMALMGKAKKDKENDGGSIVR
jgi:hypothetical protein